jgi:ribonuclease VapC
MILDTSAVCAVLFGQKEAVALHSALVAGAPWQIGAPTLAEAAIVVQARLGTPGLSDLRSFIGEYDVHTIPFGDEHWRLAAQAYGRFGKGRHAARLNFGDCLAYATAKLSGQPLLCVGDDFPQTDLKLVPLAP